MSCLKIKAKLKSKGIYPVNIEYVYGDVTPSGLASGYDIEFTEETVDLVYEASPTSYFDSFVEMGGIKEVLEWVDSLPDISAFTKEKHYENV